MINYYNKHRFISKKELARLAGVSERTFCRYIASRRHILEAMGVLPNARLLPPQAVKYVCELHRSARIPAGQGSDQEDKERSYQVEYGIYNPSCYRVSGVPLVLRQFLLPACGQYCL